MKPYKRIFTIVIDSMGIGAAPDADKFGDAGCDTLGHIDEHMPSFKLPNMAKLGITALHPLKHVEAPEKTEGYQLRLHVL